jgi:hypothetical protein
MRPLVSRESEADDGPSWPNPDRMWPPTLMTERLRERPWSSSGKVRVVAGRRFGGGREEIG